MIKVILRLLPLEPTSISMIPTMRDAFAVLALISELQHKLLAVGDLVGREQRAQEDW